MKSNSEITHSLFGRVRCGLSSLGLKRNKHRELVSKDAVLILIENVELNLYRNMYVDNNVIYM